MFKIDACGLSCPEPLALLKDALAKYDQVEIMVNAPLVKENVLSFATKANYKCEVSQVKSVYNITVFK